MLNYLGEMSRIKFYARIPDYSIYNFFFFNGLFYPGPGKTSVVF